MDRTGRPGRIPEDGRRSSSERTDGKLEGDKPSESPCRSPVQRLKFPVHKVVEETTDYSAKEITPIKNHLNHISAAETNDTKFSCTGVEDVISKASKRRIIEENL